MSFYVVLVERFTEAIEFYDQALVGTKDVEHRSILMSNKSAALVGQKKLNEALEVASQTIQMRPSWSKGWFRAGKALFEMKSYTSAMKVFNAALLKEPGSKDIQKWIKRTEPLAAKVIYIVLLIATVAVTNTSLFHIIVFCMGHSLVCQ